MQNSRDQIKGLAKRALRPAWRRVAARLDMRIETALARSLEASPDLSAARAVGDHLPIVLGNIASQASVLRETKRSEIAFRRQIEEVLVRLEHLERIVENSSAGQSGSTAAHG